MTKRAARLFFFISTLLSALIFTVLTIDSHRQFPKLTNSAAIDARVIAGKHVWHRQNCTNCHTLLGEGAYFAPEVGNVWDRWGGKEDPAAARETLKAWMQSQPSGAEGRRQMPQFNLTDQELNDLADFLQWTSTIKRQSWPPNKAG